MAQTSDSLFVESLIFTNGDLQPPLKYRYTLRSGGRAVNRILMGYGIQETPTTTRWEGDRLVLTTTHSFAHPDTGESVAANVTRVMWLESDNYIARPPRLVVETTIAGVLGGPSSSNRTVYSAG